MDNDMWNEAILAVIKLVEEARDHSYAMEEHAKKNGLSGSPSGYRADGLRDILGSIRPLLRIEHMPPLDPEGHGDANNGIIRHSHS